MPKAHVAGPTQARIEGSLLAVSRRSVQFLQI